MKRALFAKEMRSLRPFLFVVLVLVLLDTINAFLMPFEARSFPARFASLSNELSALQIVLGFALGSNLLVREIDDGTVNFLDGLPLTRRAIFVAKIKAAMLGLIITGKGPAPAGMVMVARRVAFRSGPNSSRKFRVIWPLVLSSLRTTTLSSLGLGGKVPRSYFCSSTRSSDRRAFQSAADFTIWPSRNRSGSGSPLIFGRASKSGGSSLVRCCHALNDGTAGRV